MVPQNARVLGRACLQQQSEDKAPISLDDSHLHVPHVDSAVVEIRAQQRYNASIVGDMSGLIWHGSLPCFASMNASACDKNCLNFNVVSEQETYHLAADTGDLST